mgnify:CR=1 FL=1
MTIPPRVRVFFALSIPDTVKTSMEKLMGDIKKVTRHHAIRWTTLDNLHITLQFIGEMQVEHVPLLLENVSERLKKGVTLPALTFGKLNLFPSPFRPRVIVLEMGAHPELATLAKTIGDGIEATSYPVEKRLFRAHMTLGRIKQPKSLNMNFINMIKVPELTPLNVEEIVLFRSDPHPDGSHYTEISRLALT